MFAIAVALGVSAPLRAIPPGQAQVVAARANAVEKLLADVLDERISVDLTIQQFVEQTNGMSALNHAVLEADPVGGPRWVDDQTCLVKLSLPREKVVTVLTDLANLRSNAPVPAAAISKQLKYWQGQTFVATGISLSVERAQQLRPPAGLSGWQSVSDEQRKTAVAQAAQNAASKTLESLRRIELHPGMSLKSVLENQDVQQKLFSMLSDQPVTSVQFRDDLSVEATFRPQTDILMAAITDAIGAASAELVKNPQAMDQLRAAIENQFGQVIGIARAGERTDPTVARGAVIPTRPPEWVKQMLESTGTAAGGESRLKAARLAEDAALDQLQKQIESLPLTNDLTVGAYAGQNADAGHMIQDLMRRARVSKISYLPDGSASVRVVFDPRDLWDALRQLP